MRRILWAAAMTLLPSVASAQFTDLSYNVTGSSASGFTFEIFLRNLQPYQTGQVFDIQGVNVSSSLCPQFSDCSLGQQVVSTTGLVDLRTFDDPGADNRTLNGTLLQWNFSSSGFLPKVIGPASNSGGIYDYGLIGCSLPLLNPLGPAWIYGGRTCLQEGFTGSLVLRGNINYSVARPGVVATNANLTVSAITRTVPITTYSPVPEPSTWLLMAGGLLAVAAVARRRQRA